MEIPAEFRLRAVAACSPFALATVFCRADARALERCDESHRQGPVTGPRICYEGVGHGYHAAWFVRTPLADPSDQLSRHAPPWALL